MRLILNYSPARKSQGGRGGSSSPQIPRVGHWAHLLESCVDHLSHGGVLSQGGLGGQLAVLVTSPDNSFRNLRNVYAAVGQAFTK